MSEVVDELLEPEELDGAQRPPVAPVHVDLQLARLFQRKAEPVLEIFLKKSALQVNGFMMQNDLSFHSLYAILCIELLNCKRYRFF